MHMSLWFCFHVGGQESEHWEQTRFFTYRARTESQQTVIETLGNQPWRFAVIAVRPASSTDCALLLQQLLLPRHWLVTSSWSQSNLLTAQARKILETDLVKYLEHSPLSEVFPLNLPRQPPIQEYLEMGNYGRHTNLHTNHTNLLTTVKSQVVLKFTFSSLIFFHAYFILRRFIYFKCRLDLSSTCCATLQIPATAKG